MHQRWPKGNNNNSTANQQTNAHRSNIQFSLHSIEQQEIDFIGNSKCLIYLFEWKKMDPKWKQINGLIPMDTKNKEESHR